ncbi:hypothetical protein Scep_021912 [Stephania cephalantha]|uniref:Uncharacterized protein n=1 Tax=Stephania cephalantha TaxID=152367 RepID=A0AAP0FCT8_9MAGN
MLMPQSQCLLRLNVSSCFFRSFDSPDKGKLSPCFILVSLLVSYIKLSLKSFFVNWSMTSFSFSFFLSLGKLRRSN